MFGLFKKKTEIELLEIKYKKLLQDAYELSTKDRKASDLKTAEASKVADEIQEVRIREGLQK